MRVHRAKSNIQTGFVANSRQLWATTLLTSTLVLAGPLVSFAHPESGSGQGVSQNAADSGRNADESDTTGKKTGFNKDEKPVPVTPRDNSINKSTAQAVNSIPGVNINPKNLEPPPEEPEIKGFHPIKKLMAPIVRLERNSVQLQQQIMKLEGPIAGLNPPMVGLQKRMVTVQSKMGLMQDKIQNMNDSVIGVSQQMTGVRQDIRGMRRQISELQSPIEALRPPIEKLQKPLVNVAEPLTEVKSELAQMKALLATVLGAIVLATLAISIGTPIAAIVIFRNRKKIFPRLSDQELVPDEKKERHLAKVG